MDYRDARQFFEAVRSANCDIERCQRDLAEYEGRAFRVSSANFGPHVRTSAPTDAMGGRVAAMVDREQALSRRVEYDYAMIDAGCAVLYGRAGARGLDAVAPSPAHADAIWHRYCAGERWEAVACALRVSDRTCRRMCAEALRIVDERGLLGLAEPILGPCGSGVWETPC
jgi:hypothetical protein